MTARSADRDADCSVDCGSANGVGRIFRPTGCDCGTDSARADSGNAVAGNCGATGTPGAAAGDPRRSHQRMRAAIAEPITMAATSWRMIRLVLSLQVREPAYRTPPRSRPAPETDSSRPIISPAACAPPPIDGMYCSQACARLDSSSRDLELRNLREGTFEIDCRSLRCRNAAPRSQRRLYRPLRHPVTKRSSVQE